MVIDQAAVLAALDHLRASRVTTWVDGGWGIDALVGEQTRPREDLDLVVEHIALDAARSALSALGTATIRLPNRDFQPASSSPTPRAATTGVGLIGGRRLRCLTPELNFVTTWAISPTRPRKAAGPRKRR
jgi:aminoglycoside-2''-adenylyltransferase